MTAITPPGLQHARQKMQDAGASPAAIATFESYYHQLASGSTGLIPEESITPIWELPTLAERSTDPEADAAALKKTVIIKLNGGLGTSMGLDKAKTLLPVREGMNFLDIIVDQVTKARAAYAAPLPLLFMNSFNTQTDTLQALKKYPHLAVENLPIDFLQSQEPKLHANTLEPVSWPTDPALEWCPPGHGDLYPSLLDTGILEQLIEAGYEYANVSNADNLGAAPNAQLAGWFASTGSAFAMEVCKRTQMDRKGGHLAQRLSDNRLVLREVAQTLPEDLDDFQDITKHAYFNTNTLWLHLPALLRTLQHKNGAIGLPMIANRKTVDPKDATTTPVIQIESAMGAAIEIFDDATAIEVPRSRFLPVKTTNELLLIRSDVYHRDAHGHLVMTADTAPTITLDPNHYKKIADFEARFPAGPPSLCQAESLTIEGDWTFENDIVITGTTTLTATEHDGARTVPAGTHLP
ncbi:UTP--glucose-1-phosphate uridylyltransferase [Dermatophilus congolensis]|uniref:UTP--glucose-1-phosphate uridylyltransferase n=1 Tax=Dermatophilus congolensis TaxID=1863 RepID=A0AA46BQF1_9MICO|nr:UTP--glucose-1-phosphate uridylyltransferase [Dermatophilus congolensis]STD15430.1 UTP--glucose-1-phosphate uridylyltransferase [Dermatophilus congolensis]